MINYAFSNAGAVLSLAGKYFLSDICNWINHCQWNDRFEKSTDNRIGDTWSPMCICIYVYICMCEYESNCSPVTRIASTGSYVAQWNTTMNQLALGYVFEQQPKTRVHNFFLFKNVCDSRTTIESRERNRCFNLLDETMGGTCNIKRSLYVYRRFAVSFCIEWYRKSVEKVNAPEFPVTLCHDERWNYYF